MQPNGGPDRAGTALAHGVLAIAGARSPADLGREIDRMMAAPLAVGLYLHDPAGIELVHHARVPEGFLCEYDAELSANDPLVDAVRGGAEVVDGPALLGLPGWRQSAIRDHLRRWGYRRNLCGALSVEGRLAGVLYVATRDLPGSGQGLLERLDLVCRAGSIALTAMAGAGLLERRGPPPLPPRSAAVARLVCAGQSNKQIARALGISDHTAKEHVANLCRRFGVRNRTELAGQLLRAGADR